jgi:homoserine dehydrogenase
MTLTLDLVLVGFGHVARRFVTLLAEQRRRIAREHDLRVRVIAVATKRHGQVFSPGGVRAASLAARVAADQSIGTPVSTAPPGTPTGFVFGRTSRTSSLDFVRAVTRRSVATARQRRLVVVETTTLDIARGEPAISHIRAALAGGAHVITANKGPVAFA